MLYVAKNNYKFINLEKFSIQIRISEEIISRLRGIFTTVLRYTLRQRSLCSGFKTFTETRGQGAEFLSNFSWLQGKSYSL